MIFLKYIQSQYYDNRCWQNNFDAGQIAVISEHISLIIVTLHRLIIAIFSPFYFEYIFGKFFLHRFKREFNGNVVTGIEIDGSL